MTSIKTLKTTTRAALAAIIIGAAGVSAMPAQAAQTNFGISFNTGNGLSIFLGEGPHRRNFDNRWDRDFHRACLGNREIRRSLRHYGYHNIRFGKQHRNKVRVIAVRGRWVHTLRVNRCNGRVAVIDRERVRQRDFDRFQGGGHRGGASFSFNIR